MSASISWSSARDGPVGFTQIAGLVARRIVPFVKAGDIVAAGQRVGLIRFGSRVDVYLPAAPRRRCCSASGPSPARRSSPRSASRADRGRRPVSAAMDRSAARRAGIPLRARGAQRDHRAGAVLRPDRRALRDRRRMGEARSMRSSSPGCSTGSTDGSRGCCRAQSRFGAELDSLADVIAFGVAPALIIYLVVAAGTGRASAGCSRSPLRSAGAAPRAVQRADRRRGPAAQIGRFPDRRAGAGRGGAAAAADLSCGSRPIGRWAWLQDCRWWRPGRRSSRS